VTLFVTELLENLTSTLDQNNPALPGVSNHKAKLNPPKLSAGSSIETWEHFLRAFGMYRTAMSIQEDQAQIFLFNCLDEEL
jgi:hypothetical protein